MFRAALWHVVGSPGVLKGPVLRVAVPTHQRNPKEVSQLFFSPGKVLKSVLGKKHAAFFSFQTFYYEKFLGVPTVAQWK